ncbi:ABC transporter permease [Aquibaculum arenosum]|uniref:ABC transporter permease n=1 Tax=Aquibaculum arenosum TaxID=3032591 RepID=A0ABT5YQM4_9PROT|nr:ABC transporter permease [Fodinicurvata sp. CAU 1616]MDF2097238.1 ABC transporter permease [Fodinicurvata sp. CAU 1616]
MIFLLLRRFTALAITLLLASIAIFLVLEILPGDPAAIMLGTEAREDTLAALRREMGLDRPAYERYLNWLGGALSGNLGLSMTYKVPVAELVADRLAVTFPLAFLAILISTAMAVPLGVIAAANHERPADHGVMLFSQIGVAIPNFWFGLLLILFFSSYLGWFSAGGFPGWDDPVAALKALLLPAVALALPQAAILARVTRSSVLEVLGEDFVRTARAKGLTRRVALRRHVLRNALIPVVTVMGMQFSFLVAGAILVENVFTLPGLGRLLFQAMSQRDLVVIKDVVLLFAALVIVVNFLVDLAYAWLDPRLRQG